MGDFLYLCKVMDKIKIFIKQYFFDMIVVAAFTAIKNK